jgi:hypothetical protein
MTTDTLAIWVQTIILAGTGAIILWYAKETQRLRVATESMVKVAVNQINLDRRLKVYLATKVFLASIRRGVDINPEQISKFETDTDDR